MADPTTSPRFEVVNGSPDDDAGEHQFEVVNGSPDALSKREASSAIGSISRPSSATGPSTGSARFEIGSSPRRSVAEGLETEQEERRGGMPFAWHPATGGLQTPEAEGFKLVPRATQPLSSPAASSVQPREIHAGPLETINPFVSNQELANEAETGERFRRTLAAAPPPRRLTWQDYLGLATSAATNPELGAETGIPDLGQAVARGTKELTTPGKRVTGALRTAEAATEALTPFMGPAALENPLAIARGLAEGEAASRATGYVTNKAGATPEQQELAESLAFWAPGVARSILQPRAGIEISPEGTRAAATVAGGRAGAGIAVTPEGVTVRGKVGPFEGSKTFGGPKAAGPAIEAPTIEGETVAPPPTDPATLTVLKYNQMRQGEANLANGQPINPPPPPEPAPPPMPAITPEKIQQISSRVAKLPPQLRAQAMLDVHKLLAQGLLQQGKLVVDGKIEIVRDEKQADALAQRMINSEVDRIDKAASETKPQATETKTPAAETPKGVRQTRKAQAEEMKAKAAAAAPTTPAGRFEVTQEPPATPEASENAQPAASQAATEAQKTAPAEEPKKAEQVAPAALEAKTPSTVESRNAEQRADHTEAGQPLLSGSPEQSLPAGHSDLDREGRRGVSNGSVASGSEVSPAVGQEKSDQRTALAPFEDDSPVVFTRNYQLAKGEGKSEIIKAGTKAFVAHAHPNMNIVRVRLTDGRTVSVNTRYLEAGKEEPNASQGTQALSETPETPEAAQAPVAPAEAAGGAPAPATGGTESSVVAEAAHAEGEPETTTAPVAERAESGRAAVSKPAAESEVPVVKAGAEGGEKGVQPERSGEVEKPEAREGVESSNGKGNISESKPLPLERAGNAEGRGQSERSVEPSVARGTPAPAGEVHGNARAEPSSVRPRVSAPATTESSNLLPRNESQAVTTTEPKHKFGNTQANIPADSEAAVSINAARDRISELATKPPGATHAGSIEPPTLQSVRDGVVANSQKLSDLLERPAFKNKGLGGLDIPGQRAVMKHVIAALHDPEVRDGVVELIPVNVMNDLVGLEGTPEVSFHDESVLLDSKGSDLKRPVALSRDAATSLASAVAKRIAEIAAAPFQPSGRSVDGRTTIGANGEHEASLPQSEPSKVEARTAEQFTEKVQADKQGYVDRYLAANTKDGLVAISADRARSLFPEYAQSKAHAAANTESTNKAASQIASTAFDQAIKNGAVANGKEAVFVAGMPGAGKSSAENAFVDGKKDVGLFYEGNLSDAPLLERRIKAVLDAGGKATVVYVYAPPKTALERMIKRAGQIGRYVPIEYGAKVAANTPASIEKLYEKYGDKVDYRAIDNSTSEPKIEKGIDAVRRLAENRTSDAIRDEQHEHAKALRKSGKLSDELYERIRPQAAGGAAGPNRAGNGREHQEAAPGPLETKNPSKTTESHTGEALGERTPEETTPNDPREQDWKRAEAYKPPDGAPLSVRPVPASFWTPERRVYSLLNTRDSTRGGTATSDWNEIVARADKENLRMKEAEDQRLKMIESRKPKPGSDEYEKMRRRIADLEAQVSPSKDQQAFHDGIVLENGRLGAKATDYGRVVSGLANVLKENGIKPSTDPQYRKESGSPLYWELADLFHNPIASFSQNVPVSEIAHAMDGTLPDKAPQIDERGWKFKQSFDQGHSVTAMEKDLAPEGKFGRELASAEHGAERIRRKADIVEALLGETDGVKAARAVADEMESDAQKLRERAQGAIASAKEDEAKTAEELKQRPFTLAKQIQPIENATWTAKNAWVRNMVKSGEDTPWVSDGHSAINTEMIQRKAANMAGERKFVPAKAAKLLEQDPKNPGIITAANMQTTIERATKKSTSEGKVVGFLPAEALGEKKAVSPAYIENQVSKGVVPVNAHILKMIQDVVKPDSIKVGTGESAVAFFKDGKLAAVLMPLRTQPEIDVPTAKKVLSGEVKPQTLKAPTEDKESRLHEILKSEEGFFEPAKIAEAITNAASSVHGFLKQEIEDNQRARKIQWDLYDLDKRHEARVLRAKQLLEKLEKEGLTQEDRRAIDAHLDALEADSDNVPVPALTPEQDRILDDVLMPMRAEAEAAYKKVTDAGMTIPNYNPRQVKGRGGMLDRFLQPEGEKRSGRGNLLSRQMPAAKHRVMMALENGDKRVVVSLKKGRVTAWKNGKSEDLGPIQTAKQRVQEEIDSLNKRIRKLQTERRILMETPSRTRVTFERRKNITEEIDELERKRDAARASVPQAELKDREWEDKDGNIWKLGQATKEEIEKATDGKVVYYHDAAASTLVNWLQAKKAEAAHDFMENLKNDPDFDKFAVKTDKGNPPSGWRTTNLVQLKGYFLEPHVAETCDWLADRLNSGSPTAFDEINNYVRASLLLNPLQHPLNIGAQWAVQRGVTGFLPNRWLLIGRTGARAIRAVWNKNDDFIAALDAGAPLQSARNAMRDLANLFYEQLANDAQAGTPWATKMSKAIGIDSINLVKILHELSSKIAWPVSDMLYLQSAYEYEERHPGVSFHEALREVGRIIPEYRLPVRILNSKVLGSVMRSKWGTIFGSYHWGLLRSFAESAKSAMGAAEPAPGRSKAGEVATGWDRLALLALAAFALYPLADELAKRLTGDKDAEVKRHGIFGLIYAATQVGRHERTPTEALTRVITPNPVTEDAAEAFFNRDLRTGRHLYDPAAEWQTEGTQLMEFLKSRAIPQYEQIERAGQSAEGWKKFAWNQGDVNFPKHGAMKLAQEIASSHMDTSAWTPEQRQEYYARQRYLEGLRSGNAKEAEEGLREGKFDAEQRLELRRRARMTPLQDKVHGMDLKDAMRVYDAGTPEEKAELRRIIREKKLDALERGHRNKVEAAMSGAAQ